MPRIFICLEHSYDTWEDLTHTSSLVVVGRVVEQQAVLETRRHKRRFRGLLVEATIATVDVESILVGGAPETVRVLRDGGIGPDGTVWDVANYPLFVTGARYLLFLRPLERPGFDDDLLCPTGAFNGVFTVDENDWVRPISDLPAGSLPAEGAALAEVAHAAGRDGEAGP